MKVCAEPGCPELTRTTRCPEHTREQQRTTRARYPRHSYGSRWPAVRRRYLAAHPVCEHDGCTAPAAEVDHIVGVRHFDDVDAAHVEQNLQALCKPHHSAKTIVEVGAAGRRTA